MKKKKNTLDKIVKKIEKELKEYRLQHRYDKSKHQNPLDMLKIFRCI